VLKNVGKGPTSAGVTPLKQPMMCFEELTSIWPAVGARWHSKLKTLEQKVFGSNDVPYYSARLARGRLLRTDGSVNRRLRQGKTLRANRLLGHRAGLFMPSYARAI
jgi:hypothetical protein